MLYYVKAEMETTLGSLPPREAVGVLEHTILPSLEILAKWEESGKIRGGAVAGYRAGHLIVEAASHQEISDLLRSLPFWGLMRFEVTPLQSMRSALEGDRRVVEGFKKSLGL
jgi:hypothetical protein